MKMKYAQVWLISMVVTAGIAFPSVSTPTSKTLDYSNYDEPLRIELHSGLGTNISFDAVQETIETIFLDNKSFISLHTNGCVADLNGRACPANSAPTLVHLSIIDDISLSGVALTNRKARNVSMLTVVTSDRRKQKRNYVFNIRAVNLPETRPHIALVRVAPKLTYMPSNIVLTTPEKIEYLKSGFRLAVFRGDYKFNFPRYTNIQRFITALSTGEKLQFAADYDLPLETISNLIKLGTPVK